MSDVCGCNYYSFSQIDAVSTPDIDGIQTEWISSILRTCQPGNERRSKQAEANRNGRAHVRILNGRRFPSYAQDREGRNSPSLRLSFIVCTKERARRGDSARP